MGKTVQVTLAEEVDLEVSNSIRLGEFASASEVIQSALEDWRAGRMIASVGVDDLRRLWNEGVASGPGAGLTMDQIKRRARQQFAEN